jgi:hypothetical protein
MSLRFGMVARRTGDADPFGMKRKREAAMVVW